MREPIRDRARIEHMLEAANILTQEQPKHTLDEIKDNPVLFFGLAKLIEIIGEAAYKLTIEFKDGHPELPWRAIVGMRHVMVHGYYDMSLGEIMTTITTDVPLMIPILERYLKELEAQD